MDYNAFMDMSTLTDEARKELKIFYDYLTFKYNKKAKRKSGSDNKKEQFFNFVKNHTYILPENYKFNRDELHER
jgi:hypothetical protein